MLPPEALLGRLENRLPLLTGGRRDAPTRQRTLRNTIAWGYDLLSPVEQTLFRRLGVFVGGWTLDAAEAVVNFDDSVDVQQGVSSLFDKSLVRLVASGPNPRYGMLETIREFAVEQLKGTPDEAGVREAHVRYMLALASGTWWAFPERANVQDAREWLNQALTQPEHASQEARALALGSAALSAFNQGDFSTAEHLAEASLDLSRVGGFDHHTGLALYVLMIVRQEQGHYARSTAIGEQAIRHLRRSGDARWLSQALIDTGTSASLNGNVERATALREEGFALCRATGNLVGLAQAMNDLGIEAERCGDIETAVARYRESLALMIEVDERGLYRASSSQHGEPALCRRTGRAGNAPAWHRGVFPRRPIGPFHGTRNVNATSVSRHWRGRPLAKCDLVPSWPLVANYLSLRQRDRP